MLIFILILSRDKLLMESENHCNIPYRVIIFIFIYWNLVSSTYKQLLSDTMHLLLVLLFVSVLSAPEGSKNLSNDNLLIEHSVSSDSANNAIQHLVPELSKINNILYIIVYMGIKVVMQ